MFEQQIQQARDMIRRIYVQKEKNDNVPDVEKVSFVELAAWSSATKNLITHSFGEASNEIERYRELDNINSELYRNDPRNHDPEYMKWDVYIYFLHNIIGFLQELEAKLGATRTQNQPQNIYNIGNIIGSNVNIASTLSQVAQNIGSTPNLDEAGKNQLAELIEKLKIELQKSPPEKREDAEDLADSAKALVEAVQKSSLTRKLFKAMRVG